MPGPSVLTPAPILAPGPAVITPAPVLRPAPVPAPALILSRPPTVIAPAQPYVVVPAPAVRTTRDTAHFIRERCYREKGGCYTTEHRNGYQFNGATGAWDWVDQRDFRWKGR